MSDVAQQSQLVAEIQSINMEYQQIEEQLKGNLDMFGATTLPDIVEFGFPEFYHYLWSVMCLAALETKGFDYYALGLPRGHGKTILLKLFILYCILFTDRRFILIICAKDDLAKNIVDDIGRMLDEPNIRAIFGEPVWDKRASGDLRFNFRGRDIVLWGVGESSAFRGVQVNAQRPDVMIFDDAQTKECAMSETQALQFQEKFAGTMMKAKSPKRCLYLYVGNMYQQKVVKESGGKKIYGCHLRNLKDSSVWRSIIVGAILEDGQALWEDLQSKEQLMVEFQNDLDAGQPEVFFAEVLNDDNCTVIGDFNPERVPAPPSYEEEEPHSRFLVIDPSLGKKESDGQWVGLYEVWEDEPVLVEAREYQLSAPKLVEAVITWCAELPCFCIGVESYGYQATLKQWFDHYFEMLHIDGMNVVEVRKAGAHKTKNAAIINSFKELFDAKWYLGEDATTAYFAQAMFFDKRKTDNTDDLLDVGVYGTILYNTYPDECIIPLNPLNDDYYGVDVIDRGNAYGVS